MKIEVSTYNFGHPVVWDDTNKCYVYLEGDEKGKKNTSEVYEGLACPRCDMKPTAKGHDPCISNLEGVEYACCGHGIKSPTPTSQQAYIKYENGEVIRFDTTEELLKHVGRE